MQLSCLPYSDKLVSEWLPADNGKQTFRAMQIPPHFFQSAILERHCRIIDEAIAIEHRLVNFASLFLKSSRTERCGVKKLSTQVPLKSHAFPIITC